MRRNPFEELEEMLDRLSKQVEDGMVTGSGLPASRSFAVDVADEGEEYVMTADLPGYETENIDLSIKDNTVHIEAERESEIEEEADRFLRRERRHEALTRSIRLPEEIDENAVTASYNNGVLTVTLPKVHGDTDEGHHIDIT